MSDPGQGMQKRVIVVLGSRNDDRGNLSSVARERCERALFEYGRAPDAYMLPTGGWGDHFNTTDKPHAHYLAQYLQERGVPSERLLPYVESRNTIEDARLAKPIVEQHGVERLCVVTSDFHMARARFIFLHVFADAALDFSESETNLPPERMAVRRQHEENALRRLMSGELVI